MIIRLLIAFCATTLLLVTGCSSPRDVVSFDQFSFISPKISESKKEGNNHVYIFNKNLSNTGDLLVIQSQTINPSADLDTWINTNIAILQQTYPQIIFTSEVYSQIDCEDRQIISKIIIGQFQSGKDKDPLYFGQYFFIHEGKAYVLMYSSNRQANLKDIQKNRTRISCQP